MVPGRVVVLGLEADVSCEEKCKSCGERAVKLRLEWNDNFWDVLEFQSFGRFRTGRNLDLWNSVCVVFCQLSRALHEFSCLLHDMSMGFMRRNHCDLFCSFVKGCACIGSWIWIEFAVCHKFALFLFLSETLKFGRSHITCQDVRHASWGSSEWSLSEVWFIC